MTNLIPFIVYSDVEDRCHKIKSEDYYEWWYSDFKFDNGWTAVAVWHYSDWLKKPGSPASKFPSMILMENVIMRKRS